MNSHHRVSGCVFNLEAGRQGVAPLSNTNSRFMLYNGHSEVVYSRFTYSPAQLRRAGLSQRNIFSDALAKRFDSELRAPKHETHLAG